MQIRLTPVHGEGQYYRIKDYPHYIVRVSSLSVEQMTGEVLAHTWAYNVWGGVCHQVIAVKNLEPYGESLS